MASRSTNQRPFPFNSASLATSNPLISNQVDFVCEVGFITMMVLLIGKLRHFRVKNIIRIVIKLLHTLALGRQVA